MSIEIKKFGKIKEALIETNGLTVIAGHNDTGKSTIGKLLYSIIKSQISFPDLYDKLTNKKTLQELNKSHKSRKAEDIGTDKFYCL